MPGRQVKHGRAAVGLVLYRSVHPAALELPFRPWPCVNCRLTLATKKGRGAGARANTIEAPTPTEAVRELR